MCFRKEGAPAFQGRNPAAGGAISSFETAEMSRLCFAASFPEPQRQDGWTHLDPTNQKCLLWLNVACVDFLVFLLGFIFPLHSWLCYRTVQQKVLYPCYEDEGFRTSQRFNHEVECAKGLSCVFGQIGQLALAHFGKFSSRETETFGPFSQRVRWLVLNPSAVLIPIFPLAVLSHAMSTSQCSRRAIHHNDQETSWTCGFFRAPPWFWQRA